MLFLACSSPFVGALPKSSPMVTMVIDITMDIRITLPIITTTMDIRTGTFTIDTECARVGQSEHVTDDDMVEAER